MLGTVASGEDQKVTLETLDGRKYVSATVSRITSDGVVLTTSDGVEKIRFENLAESVQKQFNYHHEKTVSPIKGRIGVSRQWRVSPKSQGGISIKFISREQLEAEKRKELENQRVPSTEWPYRFGDVPKGGTIEVTIHRSTIGAANLSYFSYIVEAGGRELLRMNGQEDIANIPIGNNQWWNLELIDLPAFEGVLNLRVVDRLSNKAFDFRINPPGNSGM